MSALLTVLFSQEVEFAPDPEAQAKGLGRIINNPDVGAIFVARAGERVVGMVSLLFTISTALGGRVALLEDMIVAAPARGAGVGTWLLSEAIAFARGEGIQRVTLLTDRDNDTAQRLYGRQGFAPSSMLAMRLSLTGNGDA